MEEENTERTSEQTVCLAYRRAMHGIQTVAERLDPLGDLVESHVLMASVALDNKHGHDGEDDGEEDGEEYGEAEKRVGVEGRKRRKGKGEGEKKAIRMGKKMEKKGVKSEGKNGL